MPRERTVFYPAIDKVLERGRETAWETPGRTQHTVPLGDPSAELGIPRRSRILVFAGGAGTWAKLLAKRHDVQYTDVSGPAVEKARRAGLKTALARNAFFAPVTPKFYDWSFSFEPFPLHNNVLPFTLVRSLTNNRGAKIVYAPFTRLLGGYEPPPEFALVSRLYGAAVTTKKTSIQDRIPGNMTPHFIVTLTTNDNARRLAMLDLQTITELNRKRENRHVTISQLLARPALRKLGVTERELRASLDRIHEISAKAEADGGRICRSVTVSG